MSTAIRRTVQFRILALVLIVAGAVGLVLLHSHPAAADETLRPDRIGIRSREVKNPPSVRFPQFSDEWRGDEAGICAPSSDPAWYGRPWGDSGDGVVAAGMRHSSNEGAAPHPHPAYGRAECRDSIEKTVQGLVRFPVPTAASSALVRAELTFRRLPATSYVNTWARCDEQDLGVGPAVNEWPGGATLGQIQIFRVLESRIMRSGDTTFSVDVTDMVRGWQSGTPNRGFALLMGNDGWEIGGARTPEGRWEALCAHRYGDFALRLVTATPAPPTPGPLRPMVIHGTAYRGPVGTIPAPALQMINARVGGISGHICGTTRVTDRGAYRLEINSAAQDPRCFRLGQEITLEITPGIARTRDGRPVPFTSGGDVMLDIGLGG